MLHPETNILTENGIKKIKDLKVGDRVKSLNGNYNKIVKKNIDKMSSLLMIIYKNNYVLCTENQKFVVKQNNDHENISVFDLNISRDKLIQHDYRYVAIDKIIKGSASCQTGIGIVTKNENNFFVSNNDVFILTCNKDA